MRAFSSSSRAAAVSASNAKRSDKEKSLPEEISERTRYPVVRETEKRRKISLLETVPGGNWWRDRRKRRSLKAPIICSLVVGVTWGAIVFFFGIYLPNVLRGREREGWDVNGVMIEGDKLLMMMMMMVMPSH